MTATASPQVSVVSVPDLAVYAALERNDDGGYLLALSPHQSADNAHEQVTEAFRQMGLSVNDDLVRSIVRENLPHAQSFDAAHLDAPHRRFTPPANPKRRGAADRVGTVVAGVATAVILMSSVIGSLYWTHAVEDAAEPMMSEVAVDHPVFDQISQESGTACTPLSDRTARCSDGSAVMLLEITVTDAQRIYTLSYGPERVVIRAFDDARHAQMWASENATRAMYGEVDRRGRFALYGSDDERVTKYADAIERAVAAGADRVPS